MKSKPGNALAMRAIRKDQDPEIPEDAPSGMGEAGRRAWAHIRDDYPHLRISDEPLLTAFCQAFDTHEKCRAILAAEGHVVTNARGVPMAHPADQIVSRTAASMASLSTRLGIAYAIRIDNERKVDMKKKRIESDDEGLALVG